MIIAILLILVVLWLLGFISVSFFNIILFSINNHPITVLTIIIFLVIAWAVGILPSPFREIAGVLFILWILSILGFLAIAGLSQLIVIAIILGIVVSLFM